MNKLTVLQNCLNIKHIRNRNMGDHIPRLETRYAPLAVMQTFFDDSEK